MTFPWELARAKTLKSLLEDMGRPGITKKAEMVASLRGVEHGGQSTVTTNDWNN